MKCPYCYNEQQEADFCEKCGANLKPASSGQNVNYPDPYQNQNFYQNSQQSNKQNNPYQQPNPYQQNNQQPYYPYPPNYAVNSNTKSGFATAGLVCGIISLFCFGFILGALSIIFSSIALANLKKANAPTGTAVGGLVCGLIGFFGWLIMIIAFPNVLSNLYALTSLL